jgi:DNA-binding protein H-NS
MATIDLSNYNLGELKGLQFDVEKEIKNRQQDEELLAAKASKSRKSGQSNSAAQFRNPEDEAQTWTGRGRKPKWVLDALSNGKSMDDLKA